MLNRPSTNHGLLFLGAYSKQSIVHVFMPSTQVIGIPFVVNFHTPINIQITEIGERFIKDCLVVNLDISQSFYKKINSQALNNNLITLENDYELKDQSFQDITLYAALYRKQCDLDLNRWKTLNDSLRLISITDYRKYYIQAWQVFMGGMNQDSKVISTRDIPKKI